MTLIPFNLGCILRQEKLVSLNMYILGNCNANRAF